LLKQSRLFWWKPGHIIVPVPQGKVALHHSTPRRLQEGVLFCLLGGLLLHNKSRGELSRAPGMASSHLGIPSVHFSVDPRYLWYLGLAETARAGGGRRCNRTILFTILSYSQDYCDLTEYERVVGLRTAHKEGSSSTAPPIPWFPSLRLLVSEKPS